MRVMVWFIAIEVTERDQPPGLVWVPGAKSGSAAAGVGEERGVA